MNLLLINCSPVKNGATAEIIDKVKRHLSGMYSIKTVCIDDYIINFCRGCKTCYTSTQCILDDDIMNIMNDFENADIIISVAPSYWADVPGQFKAFIDRCTPWCNTHEPHATIGKGKKGFVIALRTGINEKECHRIVESIEHFYGHLEIDAKGSLCLCSIENKSDVEVRVSDIEDFCNRVIQSDIQQDTNMLNYTQKDLDATLQLITSTISKCEKQQLKFAEGTSQHSLLKNRIKALYISKALIENDSSINLYSQADLENALPPVLSIINKTKNAQKKYEEGTVQYRRFVPMISAMTICKVFLENEISKRV